MKRTEPEYHVGREKVLKAAELTKPAARLLVANYYAAQESRKRADLQMRHLGDKGTEVDIGLLQYFGDSYAQIETNYQRMLKAYAESTRVGRWQMSNYGVGPVISAGFLAHLDISGCPTAGHFWNYAGLNPTQKWLSQEYTKGFIKATRDTIKGDWPALIHLCRETHRRPLALLQSAQLIEEIPNPDEVREFLKKRKAKAVIKAEFHADNMLQEALEDDELVAAYERLIPTFKWKWDEIQSTLAKRPYNPHVKQLVYHFGECVKRVSNHEEAFYGALYRQRKQIVVERNEQGYYAERAKGYKTNSSEVRAQLKEGRLPASNLDRQACNWAAKIYLSHLHGLMYWDQFGMPPPRPYTIQFLGHGHEIEIPNTEEIFPGFRAAYYGKK